MNYTITNKEQVQVTRTCGHIEEMPMRDECEGDREFCALAYQREGKKCAKCLAAMPGKSFNFISDEELVRGCWGMELK